MGTNFTWSALSENEYQNQRWDFIRTHEDTKMDAYIDTNEENIPTIGVGFNLNASAIFPLVVEQIFYGDELPAATVIDDDDREYKPLIQDALTHNSSGAALQSALNQVMQDRADYWNDVIAEAEDGFVMLAEFDSNADGVIDANDAQFNQLNAWQDTNNDGFSQTPELHSLADLDIASIDLNYTDTDYHLAGNHVLSQDEILLDMVADIVGATVGDIPAWMSGAQNSAFRAGVSEKAGYLRVV